MPSLLSFIFCKKKLFCNSFLFLFQEYNRHSELLKPESNAIDHGPSNYKSGKTQETFIFSLHTQMLYMSSSFWLLGVESRDFSHVEKEKTACNAEQIHKITTIITQNYFLGPYWVKVVVILWICSALKAILSFSAKK